MADERRSYQEDTLPESALSMRFGRMLMRYRFASLMTLFTILLFFSVPLIHAVYYAATGNLVEGLPRFRMDTRARDQFPEHPFIHAQDKFASRFGTASYIALAVVKKDGNIYDPEFLEKVCRITDAIDKAPHVNHYQVTSICHINTRVIRIEPDGSITAEMLMEEVPDEDELPAFQELVKQNPGRIYGFLVSRDETATRIGAGFITHRLDNRQAYIDLFNHVKKIQQEEEADGTVEIYASGIPILTGWVLEHAFEIILYLLLTIVLLFFLLWGYFQRLHGVAIPMVAGLCTAVWGMGLTAWVGIALDPLILVIPLLVTARCISHTVQMAERFFEDFDAECQARTRVLGRELTPDEREEAKQETATTALAKLMLPGFLAIATDAFGLAVMLITTIVQMRNLAILGSFWVVAIFFNVIILHPIMISYLPPPHNAHHFTPSWMNWLLERVGNLVTGPAKWPLTVVGLVLFAWSTYYTLYFSTIGDARPGTPLFWPDHPFNVATGEIARRFGGVDQFTIFIDGDQKGASNDGAVLQRMEAMERYMKIYADPGASVSLVDFIRQFWLTNHYGDPKWGFVPDSGETVARIVFQLIRSSSPGALRPFLTDEQEDANITFFFPDHRGETIRKAVHFADEFIRENPMGRATVRLQQHESELLDGIYYMFGPMLFPRAKSLDVFVAQVDDKQQILGYEHQQGTPVGKWTERANPDEVLANVITVVSQLGSKKASDITIDSDLYDDLGLREDIVGKIALRLSSDYDYRVETLFHSAEDVPKVNPENPDDDWQTVGDIVDHIVDRSEFYIVEEWKSENGETTARNIRDDTWYAEYELWVKNDKFKDKSFNPETTGSWTRGAQFVMAGGIMGILAAINDEVERGHVANILLIFLITYVFVAISYRSNIAGLVITYSVALATIFSLAYMALRGTGLNINTLPVQSVGVGVGVDYALYLTDRIRQEYSWAGSLDEGIRRAILTTGMAVTFTATTLVAGIGAWSFSNLRFQAEMAQLLVILMIVNLFGGVVLVPAAFSILRPRFFATSLVKEPEQQNIEAERRAASASAGT
jgi:predicted RND superfamily exporter protein